MIYDDAKCAHFKFKFKKLCNPIKIGIKNTF